MRVTDSRESWGPEREEKSSARWEPYKAGSKNLEQGGPRA